MRLLPPHRGERELAADHLQHLGEGDLLLLDRGYPAFWLFNAILGRQAHLCARISSQFAPETRAHFLQSGKQEDIVTITPSSATVSKYRKRNRSAQPLRLRIIRIDLDGTEEPEILLTSLLDIEQYPYEYFAELYHQRWPVEEDYKLRKSGIVIENFTGKSAENVKQDFYARVFTANLTSILAFPLHDQINRKCKD